MFINKPCIIWYVFTYVTKEVFPQLHDVHRKGNVQHNLIPNTNMQQNIHDMLQNED